MDFDLRQWLLILGPLFIAGVLVHGYFRMRASQNEIRMKLDRAYLSRPGEVDAQGDDLNLLKAELPNGGARVVRKPDLDEDVPMLMESVDLPAPKAKPEARRPEQQSLDIGSPANPPLTAKAPPARPAASDTPAGRPVDPQPTIKETARQPEPDRQAPAVKESPIATAGNETNPESRPEPVPAKPEKFVVINVLALDQHFPGQALVEILVNGGMQFGEMDIFHRLDAAGEPRFSLANAVEPGTFDMASMESFKTPGVTLFMRVHELEKPLDVLDEMLTIADAIAHELGGEVRDETRSVMTPQTIEHCRQSIRDFQFKHSA